MSITKLNKSRKTRISISIDPAVIKLLDGSIDTTNSDSRSELIESILRRHITDQKKCVILAGGPSEALKVKNTYRPMLCVKGKPIISWIIESARNAGYYDVIIVGSKEVISEIYKHLGENGIEYVEEKQHLNTAKTLQLVKDRVRSTFLFVPCDHYFEIDLKEMEKYHIHNQNTCTLAVYAGTEHEWTKSSVVRMEGNKIIEYVENPKHVRTHLTSLMIGFAEPEIFDKIPSAAINYSLQKDIFTELAKQGKLTGYLYNGVWKNIHTEKDANSI